MALTALEQQNQNEITNASRAGVGTGAVKQKIAVTDIISEGPIEGLVEGDASVYLNEDRLISDTNNRVYSATIDGVKMSVTNGATSTSLIGVFLSSYENLENATVTRIVTYKNVYSRSDISVGVTGLSDIEEPQITLTTPSAFFTAIMEKSGNSNVGAARVKTLSGSIVLEGSLTTITNSTTAIFTPSVKDSNYLRYFRDQTEFGTVTLEIDVRARVDFKNADDLNLLNAWAHPTGTYETNLSSPIVQYENGGFNAVQKNNIATTDVEFRPGTLNQAPLSSMFGMHGIAYFPTSFTGRVLEFIDTHSKSTGDRQAPQPIRGTASDGFDLSPAQIAEVDVLRLQFNYNSLVSISEKDGKKHDSGASYKISFTPIRNGVDQDEIVLAYRTHSGKFETPVAFEEFIYVEPLRPFDDFKVTVDRLTRHDGRRVMTNGEDGNDLDRLQATCSIARISAVMKERLNYPYTALARVSFDSKDYQQVPKRSYHCRGLKVKVPSNYTTREESLRAGSGIAVSDLYSGLWDGDFREAKVYTNNPAWVLYDILTNNRYGLGRWLEESDIDKYQLYRIARYCDELVSDGKGGLEPRYVCNAYLTKATDAYKVLKDFATTFLGILYWMDGKVFAVADQATDPVYTFSKANVVNGEFTYQGTSAKVRPNQLTVMWNNPLANYELEPLLIEDKENIAKTGKIVRQEAVAFGCTSEAQAYRYGKWKLWTGVNQREIITFKTSINATFLAPGDVIKVQDADQYDISYSGRVSGTPSTTIIPIDREVTINAGSTYELSCIFEDTSTEDGGTNTPKNTKVETRTLTTSITGPVNSLQVDIPFSSAPTKSSVWVLREESSFGVSDASEKEYKIVSVSEDSKDTYSISAVEYFDSKYSSIEEDFTLAVEQRVSPELTAEEISFAPKNVFLYPTQDPSKAGNEVTLRWDFPLDSTNTLSANVKGFEIIHTIPSQESPIFVKADTTEYLFTDLPDGIFAVGIRTVDSIGKRSPQVEAQIDVQDVFKLKIPRQAEGLPVGGVGSAAIELNSSYQVNFSVSTPSFSPPGDPTNIKTSSITSLDTLDTDFIVGKKYFILYDNSAEALKGVEYKTDTTYGINHWSTPTANDFSVSSGTVTIEENSNKVIGTSTSFLTEFSQGSIIYFSSTKAAKVTNIVNNTFLLIDRVFDTETTGVASYNTLPLDFELDSLVGEFVRTSNTTSTFKSYCSVDTDIAPQSQKTIAIYRKNSNDIDVSGGTFADPLAGNSNWSQSVPGLVANGDVVYVSTRTFTSDGLAPQESAWQTPVIYASRVDGTSPDPLTITSTETTNGVTTVTFSDGSTITVNDGTNGTSQGVIVLYSNTDNPADNTAISLTPGTNEYVYYYEWLNTYPDTNSDGIPDDAHEKPFVKFVGDSADPQGVIAIYSSVADPTDNTTLSLSPEGKEYVTFYEWTGTKPTDVPTDAHEQTFVKYVGDSVTITSTETTNGVTTVTFSDGSTITVNDGTDGTDGTSQGVIVLYSNTDNPADNTAISLTPGTNEYVYYYEWLNTYTDTDSDGIPDDAHEKTFVKFIGEDGATGRVTPIYSTVADPTDNTGLSLSPGTRAFVSFYEYTGDKITQDSQIPTNAHEFTYVRFQGETGPQGNTGFLFYKSGDASLDSAHITLTNASVGQVAIVENTSGDQKGYIYTETAPSTFEWVESQIVNRGIIFADAIGAGQLEISSNNDNTADSIFFDGTNNSIKIYSDNGSGGAVLRVRIGNLVDTTP